MNFSGFVLSDWHGTHSTVPSFDAGEKIPCTRYREQHVLCAANSLYSAACTLSCSLYHSTTPASGLHIEMPHAKFYNFAAVEAAIQNGTVSSRMLPLYATLSHDALQLTELQLDNSVIRILTQMAYRGVLNNTYPDSQHHATLLLIIVTAIL